MISPGTGYPYPQYNHWALVVPGVFMFLSALGVYLAGFKLNFGCENIEKMNHNDLGILWNEHHITVLERRDSVVVLNRWRP